MGADDVAVHGGEGANPILPGAPSAHWTMPVTSGAAKLAGAVDAERERLELSAGIWIVAGLVELIGAIGMILPFKVRWLAALAGISIAGLMVGALGTHMFAGDSPAKVLPAAFVLGTAIIVAAVRGILDSTRWDARPTLETAN